jgi:nucleoside-diphosphate-sugar epimerase
MQNVTVIGGSGFIGTRLMCRLRNNDAIESKIIDKASSKAFPDLVSLSDVRSVEQLSESISDGSVIVNLAAEHRDDVRPLSLYDDVNVGGAKNICTVASEKGVQTIIFTSSVAVYGFAPIGTDES